VSSFAQPTYDTIVLNVLKRLHTPFVIL